MRFIILILMFSAVIAGFFYAFDPSKGNITDQQIITAKQKAVLKKQLPLP